METLTISPKFQVVIPKTIRKKVRAMVYADRIELIPLQPAKRMRGFLKGIDTTVPRDPDRT
jgi:bifunctional DNA-binding transcriptional regulator/antitoxin component of YhaV-PrlF toxin-antitoxin module